METGGVFKRKTICFVTGASRGLGQALAVKFAEEFSAPVTFVLLARCIKGLKDTAEKLEAISKQKAKTVNVCFRSVDLGNLSVDYSRLFSDIFSELGSQPCDFEQAVIVHNVGSLGDIRNFSRDWKDSRSLADYFTLNVSNVVALNGQFLQTFPSAEKLNRLIINISSICALVPTKTFSLYCSGKAARDMYFQVVAAEEADQRTCVLNYAPGPLKTEMGEVASTQSADPEVTKMFESAKKAGNILEPSVSSTKLTEILQKMNFKSGDHVDVFDN